ncbi:MAG: diaminopimelate epimerase [Anaerolineae bacterium]|nr:diaminopimelate epimerase [Anaerolineae bacterium]
MRFAKMEGTSNDFIVTHDASDTDVTALIPHAGHLCRRRTGIGADGMIFVLPPTTGAADFRMRILNADGTEPEMCGNGVRCFALYVNRAGLTGRADLVIETRAGLITTQRRGDQIRVDMGRPVLEAPDIPTAQAGGRVLMKPLTVGDRTFAVTAVSMGNPHAVVYADELSDELVLDYGSRLQAHPFFPNRANIEFVRVLAGDAVQMRVFERGCGETAACGTGACASVVAGVLNAKHGGAVTVHLAGGDLFVGWDGNPGHAVFMTGPARWVFGGEIDVLG